MIKNIFIICLLLISHLASAQSSDCSFGLVLSAPQASAGQIVEVELRARHFQDITGMQYTHQWNTEQLVFEDIIFNPDLPINATNFGLGTPAAEEGRLSFLFVDNTVQGITLDENTLLYTLRFTYTGNEDAMVQINDSSIAVEIVMSDGSLVENFYIEHANVSQTAASEPALSSACLISASCSNAQSSSINIELAQSGAATFDWQGPNGFAADSEDLNILSDGVYQLSLAQNGQYHYADFYLSENQEILIDVTIDDDQCGGDPDGALSVSVSGGSGDYSYAWSTGEATSSINNLESGYYNLTITDNQTSCTATTTAVVSSINIMWIGENTTPASCNNNDGSIEITADAPAPYLPLSFAWSNGSTSQNLVDVAAGAYELTITASNGCTEVLYLGVPTSDEIETNAAIIAPSCEQGNNGSITLDIDPSAYNITWSNGATTPSINNLSAGGYSVTIEDVANGCTDEAYYYLESTTDLVVASSVTCSGPEAEIIAIIWTPTTGVEYTFDWSTGEQTIGQVTEDGIVISSIFTNEASCSVVISDTDGCSTSLENIENPCISTETVQLFASPAISETSTNEELCIDIKANNFQSVAGYQFTLDWNEDLLSFTEVNNFQLAGINPSNFGTQFSADGKLTTVWTAYDPAAGESIADNSTLFSVCFDVIGQEETTTNIVFTDSPSNIEVVLVDEAMELYTVEPLLTNALVHINGSANLDDELELEVVNASTAQNATVCVPIKGGGVADMSALQFSLAWDTEALLFHSVYGGDLPYYNLPDGNLIQEAQQSGIFRFIWTAAGGPGIPVAENTTLFNICYTAIGEEGNYPISFVDEPLIAVAANSELEHLDINLTNGSVTIDDTIVDESAISLRINSAAAHTNDHVCVPVYAEQFNDILGMQFSISWSNNLISFDEVVISSDLNGLAPTNFHSPDANHLNFAWSSPQAVGLSLAPNTALFELCFNTHNAEGISNLAFTSSPVAIEVVNGNTEVIVPNLLNGQITINESELVWPGDTDVSGLVNHFDLLNIGLAYGIEGHDRMNPNINWQAQYAEDWPQLTPQTNINYKHMDTNGDGVIGDDDVNAIVQNWDQSTEELVENDGAAREILNTTSVPLYIEAGQVEAGSTIALPIILGTEDIAAEQAYGIAFSIFYDEELVEAGSANVTFDGWLSSSEDQLISVQKEYSHLGRVDVAVSRKDGINLSGQGQIGTLSIIIEDVIFRNLIDVEMNIRIDHVQLINADEEIVPVAPQVSTLLIQNVVSNTEETINDVEGLDIMPNPVKHNFRLSHSDLNIQAVSLINAQGQVLRQLAPKAQDYKIADLAAGVYYVRIECTEGTLYRKLVKQ